MGLKNSRPLPQANAELHVAPFLQRRIRSWHLDFVTQLVLLRYRALTKRLCIDALQLSMVLGIKDQAFIHELMQLFVPKTPTRVQCMVDAMEILIALILVCQAPNMKNRFEAIFDVIDAENAGSISTTDLVVLYGAVCRAIMKIFEYCVEPDQRAAMVYVNEIVHSGIAINGKIAKADLCTHMLSDRHAIHYVKLCSGEEKPKLYVMLEKDTEFLGAIQFSDEYQMRTSSLKTVREMIHTQIFRIPPDFNFLCQGKEVKRVWEVDRLAWSTVPFALHGSPGLRVHAMARNRQLEQPAGENRFEFRYMGNTLPRYKKRVHEISPVYRHRSFKVSSGSRTNALSSVLQWRLATNWSGEWTYEQASLQAKTKRDLAKRLRMAVRPQDGAVIVKSHRGELISPFTEDQIEGSALDNSDAPSVSEQDCVPMSKPIKRLPTMNPSERKNECKRRQQRIQWKARVIAMEAQQRREEHGQKENFEFFPQKQNDTRHPQAVQTDKTSTQSASAIPSLTKTVLVHIEEDDVLPSRLVSTFPKKRKRPRKKKFSKYEWYVPSRRHPTPANDKGKLVVKLLSEHTVLKPSPCSSDGTQIDLGGFLASSNICLESDEVEVFPALIIRPIEDQVSIEVAENVCEDLEDTGGSLELASKEKVLLQASLSYLSEFEHEISVGESNYETLFHHIESSALQDALALNRRDVFGRTMLHDAAEFGHGNVMELLLKARVLLNLGDSRGDTALHHAARRGRLREVSSLLRENAVAWKRNSEGKSPLFGALESASRELVLHQSQPSAATTESTPRTTQNTSLEGGKTKDYFATHLKYPKLRQVIDLLWDRYPSEELSAGDIYDRQTCLDMEKNVYGDMFHACRNGNLLRVQRLIDLEKRPIQHYINDQLDTLGRTALHEATELGHTAIADLLLKVGADGYMEDQRRQIPLHIAAAKGYERIAKCLMFKFPGTLSFQDVSGKTPLHLAIEKKHWIVAKELLAAIWHHFESNAGTLSALPGFSAVDEMASIVNLQDVHGYTPLHYACIHGNDTLCFDLLRSGAHPMISRVSYPIQKGARGLQDVFLKRASHFRCAGVNPSVASVRNWASSREKSAGGDLEVAFDVESPLEMLLMGCKQRLVSFGTCTQILERILSPHLAHEWEKHGKRDFGSRVKKSQSPLFHLAADIASLNMSGAVEICRHLSKLQLEINMVHHRTGETVLLQECKRVCAAQNGPTSTNEGRSTQLALVRTLVELGANVNLANQMNGETPLACAAWYGHLQLLDLLLETQPDRDFFLRSCSFSPLHFAALGSHVACAKMLVASHATVNVEMASTNDETPLLFAIRSKSAAMVKLLLQSGASVGTLCTVRRGTTSFRICLDVTKQRKPLHAQMEKMSIFGPSQTAISSTRVVSPLTFALEVASATAPFSVLGQRFPVIAHALKHAEWEQMGHICLMLANKIGETTATSGLITRSDIYLASRLGYWELVKMLLSHQVILSGISTSSKMNALHLAAAAGQTSIVSALIAAGMDVNCIVVGANRPTKKHHPPPLASKALMATMRRTRSTKIGTLNLNTGALFYALVNGHVDTAVKLIVLGANPLKTLPHSKKLQRAPRHANQSDEDLPEKLAIEERRTISFFLSEAMQKQFRTSYITGRYQRRHLYTDPGIHFARHLERSINEKSHLMQIEASAGYTDVVQSLVNAGMSIFQIFPSASMDSENEGQLGAGETAIHAAVSRGHLELLKYFAKLAQNNFPRCFLREGKKPKSLLVSACENHQFEALGFLLKTSYEESDTESGGGFKYDENRDEFQRALSACASHQFPEGLRLLIAHGAQPDLLVLVQVLQGLVEQAVPETLSVGVQEKKIMRRPLKESRKNRRFSNRCTHPINARNTVAGARELLETIISSASNLDEFFSAAASFDVILKVLIVCARCEFWFVLRRLFVNHAARFLESSSPWKPMVIRAVSCCLVLHRAALQNQVDLVRFILALGVPADLRLSEIPSAKSPIWYAASRGCMEAFILLAVAMESQSLSSIVSSLEYKNMGGRVSVYFRSIQDSRSFLAPGSICKWHNLSAFSCYDVPRAQTNGFQILKLINYAKSEHKNSQCGNSLLHIACRRGDLLTVQVLIDGGAAVAAENALKETPLVIAAERRESHNAVIVRYLLSILKDKKTPSAATMINQALVRCYAQPGPCNLKIAKMLLAARADVDFAQPQSNGSADASAMHFALQSVQFAAVKLLLDHGATLTIPLAEVCLKGFMMSPNVERKQFWRRFKSFLACKDQRLLEMESLMKMLLEKKHFKCAMNEDLLHQLIKSASAFAATVARVLGMEKKFWEVVTLALDMYPEESKARKAEWGDRTALHYAVVGLEVDVVSKLIDIGGYDVLSEDHAKQTPLHLVAKNGDAGICKLLLRKLEQDSRLPGVDAVDKRGRTALHIAVIHGHESVVELLVNAGAFMALRCTDGLNALLYACKCNRLGILMALHARETAVSRNLLFTTVGEYGIFVAAQRGAFRIVRWLVSMYQEQRESQGANEAYPGIHALKCRQERSLLHYASVFGDDEFIRSHLQLTPTLKSDQVGDIEDLLNQKDLAGYTPLLYAFGFGRLQSLQLLIDAGSNAEVIVDHSGETRTHPYAAGFNIGTLLQWFAFPGWLSFASAQLPPREKRRLTKQESICEDYLMNSSIRGWKVRKQRQQNAIQGKANPVKKRIRVQEVSKFEKIRTSMRQWRFPQLSLFDYVCDVGDSEMVKFLVNMKLPLLLRRSTYQSQRRNMLQAVRWNRTDVVQHLIAADSSYAHQLTEATQHTDGLHFTDFLEVGIDCAVARGHEDIAIYLLEQWSGVRDSGRKVADASVFAFQFAHVLQIACIRRMTKLVQYMIGRGGEQLVGFHANDGPALVYAVGFGHADIARLLVSAGAHFSSMDTFVAPSVKKWVEFGCIKEIQVQQFASSTSPVGLKSPDFVGPIEEYEPPSTERLSVEVICQAFACSKSGGSV